MFNVKLSTVKKLLETITNGLESFRGVFEGRLGLRGIMLQTSLELRKYLIYLQPLEKKNGKIGIAPS